MKKYLLLVFLVQSTLLADVDQSATLDLTFWPYEAEGCMNIRDQLLLESSRVQRIKFSKRLDRKCHVEAGKWIDYFTGLEITDATKLVVTPIISMKMIKPLIGKWSFEKYHSYHHNKELLIVFKNTTKNLVRYRDTIVNHLNVNKEHDYFFTMCEMVAKWMSAKVNFGIPFKRGEKNKLSTQGLRCINSTFYSRHYLYGSGWSWQGVGKCNTRVEVLKRDSKKPTTPQEEYKNIKCTPKLNGKWFGPYSGTWFDKSDPLDIDHVVPVRYAYTAGAWQWSYGKRKKYANYMTDPNHLLPVDLSENRSKNDSTPLEYMPPNQSFRCPYLQIWINIKLRWGLFISKEEELFLKNELSSCQQLNLKQMNLAIQILSTNNPWIK